MGGTRRAGRAEAAVKALQDRHIQVGKINTRYWVEGSHGSSIVLIHGIARFVEDWRPSFDALAAHHRVYALDLPGHGRTDKPADMSLAIADLALFIRDFMGALQIERAHVVGHSLGGAIATRLTILYPAAVDKLILVDCAGLGKEGPTILKVCTLPVLGELLTRPSRSGSARFLRMTVHDPAVMTDDLIELTLQMASLPGAHQSFLRTLRANVSLFGQRKSMYGPNLDGLAFITRPVLVIWGRGDPFIPVAHAGTAAKNLPNASVRILDNCGHIPMIEHTPAFNDLLLGFLAD